MAKIAHSASQREEIWLYLGICPHFQNKKVHLAQSVHSTQPTRLEGIPDMNDKKGRASLSKTTVNPEPLNREQREFKQNQFSRKDAKKGWAIPSGRKSDIEGHSGLLLSNSHKPRYGVVGISISRNSHECFIPCPLYSLPSCGIFFPVTPQGRSRQGFDLTMKSFSL